MEISDLVVLRFSNIHSIEFLDFEEALKLNPGLSIHLDKWYYFMNSNHIDSNQIGKRKDNENRWGIIGVYDLSNKKHAKSAVNDAIYFSKEKEVIDLNY